VKLLQKTSVKDSLSVLTNGEIQLTKGNNPLLDKIIAQGGGPVLGLFSKRYSNSKRLF
jgi:SecD/SecF fusion protein